MKIWAEVFEGLRVLGKEGLEGAYRCIYSYLGSIYKLFLIKDKVPLGMGWVREPWELLRVLKLFLTQR